VIWGFQDFDATGDCYSSEIGSEFAIVIPNQVLGCLSIRGRFSQLLCGPSIGRRARHTGMNDFPSFQFNDEKGEERPKEEIGDL
jgi:hypothetical protein